MTTQWFTSFPQPQSDHRIFPLNQNYAHLLGLLAWLKSHVLALSQAFSPSKCADSCAKPYVGKGSQSFGTQVTWSIHIAD